MDIRKIRKLIELIQETNMAEIEVKEDNESVRISRFPAPGNVPGITQYPPPMMPASVVAMAAPEEKTPAIPKPDPTKSAAHTGQHLKAPMVGTIYLAATPGDKPFVEVGQRINIGDTLCLIEAMKMYNPIEADIAGVISARLVENEQPVQFDQNLFIIDPD